MAKLDELLVQVLCQNNNNADYRPTRQQLGKENSRCKESGEIDNEISIRSMHIDAYIVGEIYK